MSLGPVPGKPWGFGSKFYQKVGEISHLIDQICVTLYLDVEWMKHSDISRTGRRGLNSYVRKWGEWERRSYNLWNALSEEWLALSEYQPCVILVKWSVVPYSAFQNSHNFTVEAISYKSNAGTKWYAAEIVIDQFNSKLFIEHVACVSCHYQDSGIKRVPLSRTVTICGRSLPPSECSLYGDFRICLGKGSDYYSYWILKT